MVILGRWKTVRFAALATVAVIALCSCSSQQEIVISAGGSGTASIDIRLNKILVDYVRELAEATGTQDLLPKDSLFDQKEIERSIAGRPGVSITSISSPDPESLNLELSFEHIETFFATEELLNQTGVLTLSRRAGNTFLRLVLNRQNYGQIAGLFPILSHPLVATLGPSEDYEISESEYLEMMVFIFGDAGPTAVQESTIDIRIVVDGELVSQRGGTTHGQEVHFQLPLLQVLLLNQPVDYLVVFR